MNIQPLGEQIIIRTIPQDSVGSIVIPDSAKGITLMDPAKPNEAVHFVEAEVVAIGPGKRVKDSGLMDEMVYAFKRMLRPPNSIAEVDSIQLQVDSLLARAGQQNGRLAPLVKPGDRILYHPAVQKFDREITDLMNGDGPSGSRYFIIREDSVLAVIENA